MGNAWAGSDTPEGMQLWASGLALLLVAALVEGWRRFVRRMRTLMPADEAVHGIPGVMRWALRHGDVHIKTAHAAALLGICSGVGAPLLRLAWPEAHGSAEHMQAVSGWSTPFILVAALMLLAAGQAGPQFAYRPDAPATWTNGMVSLFCWIMALIYPLTLVVALVLAAGASPAPGGLLMLLWLLPVIGSGIAALLISRASGLVF